MWSSAIFREPFGDRVGIQIKSDFYAVALDKHHVVVRDVVCLAVRRGIRNGLNGLSCIRSRSSVTVIITRFYCLRTKIQGRFARRRFNQRSKAPKQRGRWKLNSSTGAHEAQCGCELSSAHL